MKTTTVFVPTIKSIMVPGIFKNNGVTYAMPGWIPIDESVTVEMLHEKWVDPYAVKQKMKPLEFKIQGSKDIYNVNRHENGNWSCECKGFIFYKNCKHIDHAKLLIT